jgi:TldD protein
LSFQSRKGKIYKTQGGIMPKKIKKRAYPLVLFLAVFLVFNSFLKAETKESPLLSAMETELKRCYDSLKNVSENPLYFLEYQITEITETGLTASLGALVNKDQQKSRYLDVDVRVGSPKLDNTHNIRGESFSGSYHSPVRIGLDDQSEAIRARLWFETERKFREAQETFTKVLTNKQVKVAEEDQSDDFILEKPQTYIEEKADIKFDSKYWEEKLKKYSEVFKNYPWIYHSDAYLSVQSVNKYIVTSEGSKIQMGHNFIRFFLTCQTKAEDGMDLTRNKYFDADMLENLPKDDSVLVVINQAINELKALKDAPTVEPYSGPAILLNRASGVLFHEIFGHRIEGHRQKSESEGQTFTKKVGEKILPDFLSVYDDPTQRYFNGRFLRGYYLYDDEGVKAQKAIVVENGVLKGFLMSRSPIKGFSQSNGHGRKQYNNSSVSRQGNLMVKSDKTVPYPKLREMLIEECKKQGKPYGLIFHDISGGFTMMGRWSPQAFKVLPLLVYRVYVDGKPDEVVRGVDIVGTPLTSFSKIIATGDDYDIFNGNCGAESGLIPVSAISPSILVSELEVEKKAKGQDRPPILPAPTEEPKVQF